MKTRMIPALIAIALVACRESNESTTAPTQSEPSSELSALVVQQITEEASPIHLVSTTVQPGDAVVVKGQIMGSSQPFVDGAAAFILGDRELLTPCNELDDDHCPTPWDLCCEDKEVIRKGTATVQVIGDNGRVVKQSLNGHSGLQELSKLIVSGEVSQQSTGGNLVINAREIQLVE